jgi:outer membrane protein
MKKAALIAGAILAATTVQAKAISVSAGGGVWHESPSGWVEYVDTNVYGTTKTTVDVKDDLNLSSKNRGEGWFKITGIPLLPDLKVQYTQMKFSGSGVVNSSFVFGNIVVPTKSYVDSKLRANQVDFTLTYGVPFLGSLSGGRVKVNWGANVKVIDGYVKVKYYNPTTNQSGEDSKSKTIPVPMLHLDGQIRPVEFLGFEAEGNWVGYSGNQFYDVKGEVKFYPIKHGFVGLGYRYQRLKIDDIGGVSSDLKVKGAFAEAGFYF